MSEASDKSAVRGRHVPEPVHVLNWPLRDERPGAWLMAAGCVAVGGFAAVVAQSASMGVLMALAVACSAWRIWIPVSFSFSSKGIVQTWLGRRRRISWRDIARYECYPGGVLLLADDERTFLATLRGVFIRWNGQRAEIVRVLEYYLDRHSFPSGSTTEPFFSEARRSTEEQDITTVRP